MEWLKVEVNKLSLRLFLLWMWYLALRNIITLNQIIHLFSQLNSRHIVCLKQLETRRKLQVLETDKVVSSKKHLVYPNITSFQKMHYFLSIALKTLRVDSPWTMVEVTTTTWTACTLISTSLSHSKRRVSLSRRSTIYHRPSSTRFKLNRENHLHMQSRPLWGVVPTLELHHQATEVAEECQFSSLPFIERQLVHDLLRCQRSINFLHICQVKSRSNSNRGRRQTS